MKIKIKEIRIDGYKNLIDCVIKLGDFNVLVGPNNSGKSNLLETFQMLGGLYFSDDELRKYIFSGITPPGRSGISLCHLTSYKEKPMKFGFLYEVDDGNLLLNLDYEIMLNCSENEEQAGITSELLKWKETSKTGPWSVLFKRNGSLLKYSTGKTKKTEKKISKIVPAYETLRSVYPEFEGLSDTYSFFYYIISWTFCSKIFSLSPQKIRDDLGEGIDIEDLLVSSFDLALLLDQLKDDNPQKYNQLCETFCEILNLDEVFLYTKDIKAPTASKNEKEKIVERIRRIFIKAPGQDFTSIEEYSDGTIIVAAILVALFSDDMNVRGPILLLEESENCLHPSALTRLLRFLQDSASRWPVLITTHSPYLLNGVQPTDVHVAVVDEETGATHFEKIQNTKELRNYLKTGLMGFGDLLASNFEEVLGAK